jgi:hypothetical protein
MPPEVSKKSPLKRALLLLRRYPYIQMNQFKSCGCLVLLTLLAGQEPCRAQQPEFDESIGEVFASSPGSASAAGAAAQGQGQRSDQGHGQDRNQGSLQYSSGGTPIFSGASVDAGATPAIVRLGRGGQVRVCPKTSVAIRASRGTAGQVAPSSQHLLLSLDTGSLEINYSLGASADSIVTPDFRIVIAGPGEFRLAVGADVRGDACVRTFSGNSASILISEMMGDGSYQLKPNDSVSFHGGRISDFSPGAPACGCPAAPPVLTAETPPVKSPAPSPASTEIPSSSGGRQLSSRPELAAGNAMEAPPSPLLPAPGQSAPSAAPVSDASLTSPVPPANPGEVHVQVEAPVVFQAAAPEPEAALLEQLPVSGAVLPPPQVKPPAATASRRRGFLGHLRGFFAAMFGR